MRRTAVVFLFTLVHGLCASPLNVLFLSMDDLKPAIGAYDHPVVKTPGMDRLAAEGVIFTRAYIQQAVCAPSRMSTFTGLRPDRTGVKDLQTDLRTVTPDAVTLQQYFIQHGYRSAGAGKVMHGSKDEDPPSWSEPYTHDEQLNYAAGFVVPVENQYQNALSREALQEMNAKGIKGWKKRKDFLRDRDALPPTECLDVPDDAYADGAIANWAVAQLERSAADGKPFFLTVGFRKPHLPFVAPQKYWDLYDRESLRLPENSEQAAGSPEFAYSSWGELRNYSGIPKGYATDITEAQKKELIHGYYASVSYVDAQVAKVMEALDRTGLRQNTLVVLWGDHGWHLGDHGLWCKHTNFEQATRIPVIISTPGGPEGLRVEGVVESLDLFPTICELAGLPVPPQVEGVSLLAAMQGKSGGKAFAMSQYPRTHKNLMGYSLRTRDHRLTWWIKDNFDATRTAFRPEMVEAAELYDYVHDPLETRNRADDPAYAGVRRELEAQMIDYFQEQKK
jgi:iduronate 2-sulfatase